MFVLLSPETVASMFPEASGTIATLETSTDGFPIELAPSNVSDDDPALVVLLAVK